MSSFRTPAVSVSPEHLRLSDRRLTMILAFAPRIAACRGSAPRLRSEQHRTLPNLPSNLTNSPPLPRTKPLPTNLRSLLKISPALSSRPRLASSRSSRKAPRHPFRHSDAGLSSRARRTSFRIPQIGDRPQILLSPQQLPSSTTALDLAKVRGCVLRVPGRALSFLCRRIARSPSTNATSRLDQGTQTTLRRVRCSFSSSQRRRVQRRRNEHDHDGGEGFRDGSNCGSRFVPAASTGAAY